MYEEQVLPNYFTVLNNPQNEREMEFSQQVQEVSAEINDEARKEIETIELKYWQIKLQKIMELYEEYVA